MAFTKKDAEKLTLVDKAAYEDAVNKLRLYHDGLVHMYREEYELGEEADEDYLIELEDEAAAIRTIIRQLEDSVINVYTKTSNNGLH